MGRKKTSNSALATAKSNAKLIKQLKKKMPKPEMKIRDFGQVYSIDNVGTYVQMLTGISAGTGKEDRIGNRIDLKEFRLRYMCSLGDPNFNNLRIMLIKTFEPLLSIAAVFESTSLGTLGAVYANVNKNIVQRVHYDKNITLNQQYSGGRSSHFQKRNKKMNDVVNYSTSLGASVQDNYYVVLVSDSGFAPHPNVHLCVKTLYTDV